MQDRFCLQMVSCDEGCGGNGNGGGDSTPIGTVISYMGTKAPAHYLVCDGAIYNIADYEGFSQFIKDEFGSFDFFGGDGITTFAVPDLRGEFLRGTGVSSNNTGAGASVGTHQDPTFITDYGRTDGKIQLNTSLNSTTGTEYALNKDFTTKRTGYLALTTSYVASPADGLGSFSTRPTNTAVLYCIKYE
ncbi:MAG: phage tail protein [Lacrimispora sp.]|uniref:phage tail protein n=1 Tax=Lacrimispora sp. TaxID=2719234 RepID=UPI0039E281EF